MMYHSQPVRLLHVLHLAVAMLLSLAVTASPGGSLVVDAQGTAYFTTAAGVWKQAPNQKPELIAPGMHVHHLLLDSSGALLGDHVWYADARQLFVAGHYNWRYTNGKGFERITDSIAGGPREKSLVQDAFGNRYALEYGIPCIIWQTDKYGNLTALAQVSFSRLGTLHITAKGVLSLIHI